MEWNVMALVLLAAVLHASWNAAVKIAGDQLLALAAVMVTGAGIGLAFTPFVPLPARECWPYLGLSALLHGFYNLFLVLAYRVGDLSQVYPIARGVAPLGVALLSAMLAGELLSGIQTAGLLIVSAGIGSLALGRTWSVGPAGKPLALALATGGMIGAYSFVDGQGVRLAGHPLAYIAWQFFLAGVPIAAASLWLRRGEIGTFLRVNGLRGFVAGLLATVAYAIVIWAMSASPMAHVASLRETSVIVAAWIGTRLLGEPFGLRRVLAATAVAAGLVGLSAGS